MGVELGGRNERHRTFPAERQRLTIEDRIVEIVEHTIASAIQRAEARGEERARTLKTHLSVPEAAQALGISETHCRSLIDEGTVKAIRLGTRVVISRKWLEDFGT